jgi:c-di-AMP phosphodiesterase-like protein
VVEDKDLPQVVRMTIDSQGIKRIERLAEIPNFAFQRQNSERYLTLVQEDLVNSMMQFQVTYRLANISADAFFHLQY